MLFACRGEVLKELMARILTALSDVHRSTDWTALSRQCYSAYQFQLFNLHPDAVKLHGITLEIAGLRTFAKDS